jgi:hypothetical protein
MKKIMTIAAVSLLIVALGAGVAFADMPGRGNANGVQLHNTANSMDELLEIKLARIDLLVDLERLTPEQAEMYRKVITERMENCDGATRQEHSRLGIGFGRTTAQGTNQGSGYKHGR